MGLILTTVKNVINSVKRFNETNSRIKRNISDIRKCTRDITSIMRDINSMSYEVKAAIKECSSTLQTKLCQQIFSHLTTEDIEFVHHIMFYKEFLCHIEEMQRIDREILSGDMISYLLDETIDVIKKYKKTFRNDEGRYKLLAQMENFLEINNHYELESFSLSDDDNTLMTTVETIKDAYDICTKEGDSRDEKPWISMTLLGKSKETKEYKREKQTIRGGRNRLVKLCKWKQMNVTEGSASVRCIKTLTSLLKLQKELSKMITDHLSRTSFADTGPVRAYIIKHIIDRKNYFELDNEAFTPGMAKINSKLEKIIKRHDLTEINLKVKINADINFKEAVEILDDAAKKIHTVKDEVIENTKKTKDVIVKDIETFGTHSSNSGSSHSLDIIPFRNTLGLLKLKGSETLENNIEAILSRPYFAQNFQAGKLMKLTAAVADTRAFMMHPKQYIQDTFLDGNDEIQSFLLHILDDEYRDDQETIHFPTGSTERTLSQLRRNVLLYSQEKFLHEILGNQENEKFSESIIIPMLEKLARMNVDEKNVLDTIFHCLLNERQELLAGIQDATARNLISEVLNAKMDQFLATIARIFSEDLAIEGTNKRCNQISQEEVNCKELGLFMKDLFKAVQYKEENFRGISQLNAILAKQLLFRMLK